MSDAAAVSFRFGFLSTAVKINALRYRLLGLVRAVKTRGEEERRGFISAAAADRWADIYNWIGIAYLHSFSIRFNAKEASTSAANERAWFLHRKRTLLFTVHILELIFECR